MGIPAFRPRLNPLAPSLASPPEVIEEKSGPASEQLFEMVFGETPDRFPGGNDAPGSFHLTSGEL
jgi:hypothetical protein